VPSLSEVLHEILCQVTATQADDGVMQSVTLVDGRYVRRTTLPRDGNVRRDSDDVFVWEHVGLLLVNGCSRFVLCVVIQTSEAQFLDDIWHNFPLCDGSDRVPSLSEDLRQPLCDITASETKDGERQSETFADEHCVRHTVRVSHNVRRASRRVQTQDSPDRHVHGEHVERPSRRAARRRSHHGRRVRPRRSPAWVRSEVATLRKVATHI